MIFLFLILVSFAVFAMGLVPAKTDYEKRIREVAEAIAVAEGFYVSGSVAQRANNPGNLKLSDDASPLGKIGGKTIFPTIEDGWQALERQLRLILSGQSKYYNALDSLRDIAVTYTGNDKPDAWAKIVAGKLGVSVTTRFKELFNV